jgi:acyl-CoA thioester hydrolase
MTAAYDIKQLKDYSLYPVFAQENMRYRDLDTNAHMNNAVYATYFELARGRARRARLAPRPPHTASVVGRQLLVYHQELKYPAILHVGAAIVHISRSTWTWGNAVFNNGVCHATGEVTMIMVDTRTRKAAEIPPEFRASLEALRLRKTDNPLILKDDL